MAAGLQLRGMALGVDVISGLPPGSESQVAAKAARSQFAPGVLAPLEVIVRSRDGALSPVGLEDLERALREQPGYAGVAGPAEQPSGTSLQAFVTRDGRSARYVLVADTDPRGPLPSAT